MFRDGRSRKNSSSIMFLMLMLALTLTLILGQAPCAFAKTLQTNIAAPPNDAVVLNVQIGGVTLPYTWGDLTGTAGYKFAGKKTADTFLAQEPRETCVGIKLSDLLADIEGTLGVTLQDSYRIKAVSSDGYAQSPFTVAEARNYAVNHYLLAHEVDGVPEACIGYNEQNPSVTYPATYLRIARNRGGDYQTDQFGNTAYFRLITTLQITKADGTTVVLPPVNLARQNGAGLSTLTPATAGLVLGGSGITQGLGLCRSFVYLNQAQVDYLKAHKSVAGLGLGNSWQAPVLYSSYDNHGVPEYTYTLAEGINLKTALTALGADVTSAPVAVEAKSSDGYVQIVDDAFGYLASRNYIAPDGTVGDPVDPILVFYANKVSTLAPGAGTVVPVTTTALKEPNPLFAYGQKYATEKNNCSFVQNTVKIRAGLDTPAFTVSQGGTTKSISLSEIALRGIYHTSYFWEHNGAYVTQNVVGVPLSRLLAEMGITVPDGMGLTINVDHGGGPVAASRTISKEEISKCFVAFDAFADSQRVAGSIKPLRLYCPGQIQSSVLIENVVGATVSAVSAGDKGDVNGDTQVNIQDVVLAVNFVLGKTTPGAAQFSAADYNGDAVINVQDVVLIVNKLLGR